MSEDPSSFGGRFDEPADQLRKAISHITDDAKRAAANNPDVAANATTATQDNSGEGQDSGGGGEGDGGFIKDAVDFFAVLFGVKEPDNK